jgi:hypothetical protein
MEARRRWHPYRESAPAYSEGDEPVPAAVIEPREPRALGEDIVPSGMLVVHPILMLIILSGLSLVIVLVAGALFAAQHGVGGPLLDALHVRWERW